MSQDKRVDLCVKLMKLLNDEGLAKEMSGASVLEAPTVLQNYLDALTAISGRVITAYLLKGISEGMTPELVTEQASIILDLVDRHLNTQVDQSLAQALDLIEELVKEEDKGQTSH